MFVVYTILILCLLILVHEFGHFIVAKINGIYVEEFALGMGPKIIQWGKNETKYSIRLFPIGGFCKMKGEDDDSEDPRAFCRKTVLQRMAVVFCGPAMNFIAAIVLFVIAYMAIGVQTDQPVVNKVMKDTPAAVAQIQKDDKIIAVNGQETPTWLEAATTIRKYPNKEIRLKIQRDNDVIETDITPLPNAEGQGVIGIKGGMEQLGFFASIQKGVTDTYGFTKSLIVAIVQMITGKMPVEVGGPVEIARIVDTVAQQGILYLLTLAGILSINLGVMNLLPIPALDGSRLVFLAVEGIRKKPVAAEKEAMVHFIGLMAMFALMILITYQDIARIVGS